MPVPARGEVWLIDFGAAGKTRQAWPRLRGARQAGVRAENWLTRGEAERLLRLPDVPTLKGKRDQVLALLVGCGLRRSELAALTLAHPAAGGPLGAGGSGGQGKAGTLGAHARLAKAAVDRWTEAAVIAEGRVLRAVNKENRVVSDRMTLHPKHVIRAGLAGRWPERPVLRPTSG